MRWRSIRVQLPALIFALLTTAVIAASWSAYAALKTELLRTAAERLTVAAQRLAAALDESAVQSTRDASRVARDAALVSFAASPTRARRAAAQASLDHHVATGSPLASMVLADRHGGVLLASGKVPALRPPLAMEAGAATDTASHGAFIGPLVIADSGVYTTVTAPVIGATGDTSGYVIQMRRSSPGQPTKLIESLIGSEATLLFGNQSGGPWTDLARAVAGPSRPFTYDTPFPRATPNGGGSVGVVTPVRHTPWLVLVRVPRAIILAPARRFLYTTGGISIVIVALGALCAWLVSRRLTLPLGQVTVAARDFADGDYSRRAPAHARGELGELAESFNAMAQQVQDTTSELEMQAIDLESANEDLRNSEARYRSLVELSPDGILVHTDGQLVYVNAAAAALLGADSPEQLLGRSVLDFVHADAREAARERIIRTQSEGATTPRVERTLLRVDGGTAVVEAMGIPFTYDGRPAAQTILRDINERKLLEQQLAQAQKMEAVGRLAGGVAHDFNNLLTVITSYSSMALEAVDVSSPLKTDIEEIRDAATRAAELTRQLLAFSRKQVLQPKPVDLNEIVGRIDKMLARLIGEDIVLVSSCSPDLDLVSADPGQIEQVLMNLAVNARDAMPRGGRLTIETTRVELSEHDAGRHLGTPPGRYVMLAVSDTGTGMSRETMSRAFEPFFTTKEPGRGTGLGLATVYGIVKQSGGDISLYSELGRGTSFKIYLPSIGDAAIATSMAAMRPASPTAGTETVLVVEDDESVRTVVVRVLRQAGFTVLEAVADAQAVAICERPAPAIQLIITDLVMPGMGGRQLARALQQRRPNARVLFMSGYTEDAVMRHRFLEREAAFIGKPFTPERLVGKVREVLDAA
jgi:PAS domain S-box-containing protein